MSTRNAWAGEELFVTQSAISRQIKALEEPIVPSVVLLEVFKRLLQQRSERIQTR